MRIIQITDLHINAVGEDSRGVDVRTNFNILMEELREEEFDYLVVSGDLSFDKGNADVYEWIKKELETLEQPYYIITGNHDDNNLIKAAFELELKDGELFYQEMWKEIPLFFLDTSAGSLSTQQMDWLKQQMPIIEQKTILVFIHHPPCLSGVKYMDSKHPLRNIEEVQALFSLYGNKEFYFFCGHCHTENYIRHNNQHTFITPSNYFQMRPGPEDFEIAHYKIGFRVINVESDSITTNVRYIFD